MSKIHSTALVDSKAKLADDVEIGPYCVVENDVEIGPGTCLREGVVVRKYTTIGSGNFIDAHAVLGGEPQDFKFDRASVSRLRIGNNNVIREGVTLSRGTGEGSETVVGNNCYLMACSHAGHNAIIEDNVILVNSTVLAGHATACRGAILSAYTAVHQFCWVGEMVMSQAHSGMSTHVPPYTLIANINSVVGLNTVGLHRAKHISDEDRRQIKEAFNITYRSGLSREEAMEKMDSCTDWGEAAGKFREFIRRVISAKPPYNRGLARLRMTKT